jgi:hypothetical protein
MGHREEKADEPVSVFDERRAKDRTSDQPQVKLSLLRSNSLKIYAKL